MKKYSGLLPLMLVAVLTLIMLSGCTGTATLKEYEQSHEQYNVQLADVNESDYCNTNELLNAVTLKEVIPTESGQTEGHVDYYEPYGIGGGHDYMKCSKHVYFFHEGIDMLLGAYVVSIEEFHAWAHPLREIEAHPDDCLVNVFTMIQHFNVPRGVFQNVIDSNIWYWFWFDENAVDILYSGDRVLVDQFFAIGGQAEQESKEREYWYWRNNIVAAQQIVFDNNTEMSHYFHDVWTYIYFLPGRSHDYPWIRRLIDAGEYDRVNIAELINGYGLNRPSSLSPGLTIFEHWANYYNMNIFTHYNFDILLSGDWDLIRDYYCITNQAAHSAQVQARFDAYVAANRYTPDTSWMVSRPPTQITINPATATVQRGSQQQFAATASGPGNTQQAVAWAVQGSTSSNTTITDAGLLRVAQDETAATLTVRAVSAADTNIYATAAVTVTAQPPHSGAPPATGPSAPSGTTQRPPADSHEHDPQQQDDPAPGAATIPEPPPISPAPPSIVNPFVDVHERDWFFDYVMYVYAQGIMTGMDTTPMTFAPNAHMTRAMAVQLFYNMEGRPSVAGLPNPFTDVAQDAWYRDAVVWAANNGLVLGLGGGIFVPGNNITRAHLTLILSNYADFADISLPLLREYQAFADDSDIRYYARESVEQLFRAAVINGRPDGSFDPQGNATRAELATMMHNFR